MLITSNSI